MTAPAPAADQWTTRRLLDWITGYLRERDVDSPRVVAELLLSHVLQCERMRLYMEVDRPATADELTALRALVARAAKHEPAQYLVGEWPFHSRMLELGRCTLIPRPCTETLVDAVAADAKDRGLGVDQPALIADIGVGAGPIAISLAAILPEARVIATDVDDEILELAARNAARHHVAERITFVRGSLLDPVRQTLATAPQEGDGEPGRELLDILCANPPYISDAEWADVAPNVRDHEPERALRAGADGLDCLRPLITESRPLLRPGGLLALEFATSQADTVRTMAIDAGWTDVRVLDDHEGLARVLLARTPE